MVYQYNDHSQPCTQPYLFPILKKMLMQLKTGSAIPRSLQLLDFGCGNGSASKEYVGLGYGVVGIDSSETGIKIASTHYPEASFSIRSIYEDPKPEYLHYFDVVVSTEVVEHVYDPRLMLQKAKAYLKPSGTLIISTPYHGYLKNLMISILGVWDRHLTALWDGGHIKFFSRKTLRYLLEEQGYDVIEERFAGRCFGLWKSMVVRAVARGKHTR